MKAKRKLVYFSPEIIMDWIIEGNSMPAHTIKCLQGIPEGTKFVRGFYDSQRNAYGAVFEHPDWEEVEEGAFLPTIEALVQTIYGENE